jgi:hypothetical protein
MPDAYRVQRLERAVLYEGSWCARVEFQTPLRAVVIFGTKCNQLTCWLWRLVRIAQANKPEQQFVIDVDPRGVLTRTRVHS